MEDKNVRRVLCWVFACTSLTYVVLCLRSMYTISQNSAFLTLTNLLIFVSFESVVAAITGMAWWTILKEELSARGWGIAASLMYILIFLRPIIFRLGTGRLQHVGALVIGVIGLVKFFRPDEQQHSNPHTK